MSRTLNLVDILLTSGRNLVMMGRFTEALVPLTKLAGFRNLPEHVLHDLYSLRADIHLQQLDYQEARRQLTAAMALRPLDARNHYLMGVAIEEDETADLKRAKMYFESAVQLEADNAAYWVDFGSYLFKIGETKNGLKAIRKAYALNPGDADIIGEVAQILRREGHFQEATAKLRQSLFENHGAQAFRQLWQQNQFALIHAQQQEKKAKPFGYDRPVVLPFTPAPTTGKYREIGGKTIRFDPPEPLKEPSNKQPTPYKLPPKG
jgi:tetratricopeptide (TPR) repeat protein